jgi:hypothetical protein
MTGPLKIVICSLKSVKWLPSVQNDSPVVITPASLNSPVVNTPGSLDSLVMNTQGSLDSPVMNTPGSQLLSVLWTSIRTGSQNSFWWIIDKGVKAPSVLITGESQLPGVFALAGSFGHLFRLTPWWWIHWGVSTLRWWIHWVVTTPWWWIHRGVSIPR